MPESKLEEFEGVRHRVRGQGPAVSQGPRQSEVQGLRQEEKWGSRGGLGQQPSSSASSSNLPSWALAPWYCRYWDTRSSCGSRPHELQLALALALTHGPVPGGLASDCGLELLQDAPGQLLWGPRGGHMAGCHAQLPSCCWGSVWLLS